MKDVLKKVLKILAIILLILLMIRAVVGAGNFAYLYFNGLSGIDNTTQAKAGQIKIACVGDSITYGYDISGWPKNNYPAVMQKLLGDGYHVNNYGVSAYAVQEDTERSYRTLPQYQESLAYDADYVVFMMGTNDSNTQNWKGADAFRTDLESLLDSYSNAEIILCTLPAAFFLEGQTEGVTNHDVQPLVVNEIAQITREVAAERGCTLVDIHGLTVQHPEWFEKDGVHPGKEGAAAIAQAVSAVLTNP